MRPTLAAAEPGAASVRVDRLDGRWVLLPAGLALLLLRPLLPAGPIRWWLLVASYGWLLAVSARTDPLWEPGTGSLRTAGGAFGAGAVAFGLVFVLAAPPVRTDVGASGLALTVLAAVAEEAFFRGFLYARVGPLGVVPAIVVSAGAFALVHAVAYPTAALWVDLAAGGLLGWQRWVSGTWMAPAASHALANLLAVTA